MRRAWAMFRSNMYVSFSEALKSAWAHLKLTLALKAGTVSFRFRKLNGEIRTATGTAITADNYDRKGGKVSEKPSLIRYFDLDRNAPRSFNVYQLVA